MGKTCYKNVFINLYILHLLPKRNSHPSSMLLLFLFLLLIILLLFSLLILLLKGDCHIHQSPYCHRCIPPHSRLGLSGSLLIITIIEDAGSSKDTVSPATHRGHKLTQARARLNATLRSLCHEDLLSQTGLAVQTKTLHNTATDMDLGLGLGDNLRFVTCISADGRRQGYRRASFPLTQKNKRKKKQQNRILDAMSRNRFFRHLSVLRFVQDAFNCYHSRVFVSLRNFIFFSLLPDCNF